MERIIEEILYEYWDCNQCQRAAIRGDIETCPGCGKARDEHTVFYSLSEEEPVTSEEGKQRALEGPDWPCSHCGCLNRARLTACRSCSAPKPDSSPDYESTYAQAEAAKKAAALLSQARPYLGSYASEIRAEQFVELDRIASERASKPRHSTPRPSLQNHTFLGIPYPLLGFGSFCLVLGLLAAWSFRSHDVLYKKMDMRWERSIERERYKQGLYTDWSDQIRGDEVEVLATSHEIRRWDHRKVGSHRESYTEQVKKQTGTKEKCSSTYESLGNGHQKKVTTCRDVPVYSYVNETHYRTVDDYKDFPIYGEKSRYKAWRYEPFTPLRATGSTEGPYWPELPLESEPLKKPDKIGQRIQSYSVFFRKVDAAQKGPDNITLSVNLNRFLGHYRELSRATFRVNNLGHLVGLENGDKVL